jgi:uncharacterized protein YndB with AHSA1/START domain
MKNETSVARTSERELIVTREFNGRPDTLFDAWTKPELLKLWWVPRSLGVTLFECESDLRVGGKYRYVFGGDPRNPEVFSGRYTEINRPARLVLTQVYEQMREVGEAVITITFEQSERGTRLTLHQAYPSKEALDGALASGMERGMRDTFDQLDGLVASCSQ